MPANIERGESSGALATQARREVAESLFRSDRYNLTDAAFLTRISDQRAFTRAFKPWTGQTPAAFRSGQA